MATRKHELMVLHVVALRRHVPPVPWGKALLEVIYANRSTFISEPAKLELARTLEREARAVMRQQARELRTKPPKATKRTWRELLARASARPLPLPQGQDLGYPDHVDAFDSWVRQAATVKPAHHHGSRRAVATPRPEPEPEVLNVRILPRAQHRDLPAPAPRVPVADLERMAARVNGQRVGV